MEILYLAVTVLFGFFGGMIYSRISDAIDRRRRSYPEYSTHPQKMSKFYLNGNRACAGHG